MSGTSISSSSWLAPGSVLVMDGQWWRVSESEGLTFWVVPLSRWERWRFQLRGRVRAVWRRVWWPLLAAVDERAERRQR